MKRLILSTIPDDFDPERDLPLGPFCFIGKEHVYAGWENVDFLPDPFLNMEVILEAEKVTVSYIKNLIRPLTDELNTKNVTGYSEKFWQIIILPYVFVLIHAVFERQARLFQFIEKYKNEPIFVELLPGNMSWEFSDTSEFMHLGILNPAYNHWLFSRILEENIPERWEAVYIKVPATGGGTIIDKAYRKQKLKQTLIDKIQYNRCGLIGGISLAETFLWSAYLNFKPVSNASRSSEDVYQHIKTNDVLRTDIKNILLKSMPVCFKYLNLLNIPSVKPKPGKLRLVGTSLYYNDNLKYFYAKCVEGGERLVCTQHGGGGCGFKILPWRADIEYKHHAYLSWGWDKQEDYPGNIRPVSSPLLTRFQNKHSQRTETLLMVGTAVYSYSFRLSSEPQAVQGIDYRKEKVSFIENLNMDIFKEMSYRPYMNENGALADRSYIEKQFPGITICDGHFHREMLSCKLLIVDHPGTTLWMALAANVPTISFWNEHHWTMSRQAAPHFDAMKEAGMFCESGKAAADKVNELWEDITGWWSGSDTQMIRKDFCYHHARSNRLWRWEWLKTLWKL